MVGRMIGITVSVNAKRVRDKIGRVLRRLPTISEKISKEIAEEYANSLHRVAQTAFTFPRQSGITKKGKIHAKKLRGRYNWGVAMPYYSMYVDQGRRRGRMPPDSRKIRRWARMSGMSVWYLRHTIAQHGTKPRKFIYPAIVMSRPRVRNIIRKNIATMR